MMSTKRDKIDAVAVIRGIRIECADRNLEIKRAYIGFMLLRRLLEQTGNKPTGRFRTVKEALGPHASIDPENTMGDGLRCLAVHVETKEPYEITFSASRPADEQIQLVRGE